MSQPAPRVLAADIGGTKTLLLLAEPVNDGFRCIREKRYENRAFGDLNELLQVFLDDSGFPTLAGACFAVAGEVSGNQARLTNLSWDIQGDALTRSLGVPVSLINDFEAVGYGIASLAPADLEILQAGEPEVNGVRAVLGAGTGLGTGFLSWQDDAYRVFPSEGSHADFAPANEQQVGLLRFLWKKYAHVSWERVVSGPGLVNIFEYLLQEGVDGRSPDLMRAMQQDDPPAAIAAAALAKSDALAVEALDIFVAVYGAEAGNLALKLLPRGGLYLAGGITPKILPRLKDGGFMQAFRDKGRFSGMLEKMPVYAILNPRVGLLGALTVGLSLIK
ncbi:MAG: glucokinase [Sulfuricellaceae bacterium]|nr:glucokinase [Sulfuricellaceae bacterium]